MSFFRLTEWTVRRGVLALILLSGLVYTSSLGGSFIWGDDDYFYIDLPHRITELESRPAAGRPAWMAPVKFAFTHDLFAYYPEKGQVRHYRPVAILGYYTLTRMFGLQPFGLHLASVAMHTLAAILVFLLVREFAEFAVAWWAAALFLAHPLHVEAVAWMSAFSEVLAGALMLLSLLLLLRGIPRSKPQRSAEPAGSETKLLLALSFTAAALALLTKETAVALPLVAALFVGWRSWPFFVIAGGTALARTLAIGWSLGPQPVRPLGQALRITAAVFLHYAKSLVWPWPLAPEYDLLHPPAAVWVVLLGSLALAAWLAYRRRWLRLPLMLMFVPLAPSLAAAVKMPVRFLAPDRNAYLAVLGIALLVAYAASASSRRLVAVLALSIWSVLTVAAVRHWRDPEALWTHTLRVTPGSKGALMNLTYEYWVTMRFAEADRLLEHGLALRPNDPDYLAARAEVRKMLPAGQRH